MVTYTWMENFAIECYNGIVANVVTYFIKNKFLDQLQSYEQVTPNLCEI